MQSFLLGCRGAARVASDTAAVCVVNLVCLSCCNVSVSCVGCGRYDKAKAKLREEVRALKLLIEQAVEARAAAAKDFLVRPEHQFFTAKKSCSCLITYGVDAG